MGSLQLRPPIIGFVSGRVRRRYAVAAGTLAVAFLSGGRPAWASFHFMQIEQVIAGVNGDTTAQAVQLRMRSNGQEQLHKARLLAWDAEGENPVVLIDFGTTVSEGSLGSRVLVASDGFLKYADPPVSPDFTMTALIPASYLSTGSITFENDEGELLVWRLSWGGSAFQGDTTGALTNDDDGDFGPPFDGPLPTSGVAALQFVGSASDLSSSNAADYALTMGPATFTNNSGEALLVKELDCPNDPEGDADHDGLCGDVDNCPNDSNRDQADADSDGAGDACDECPEDPNKTEPGLCGCGIADADDNDDGIVDCESQGGDTDDGNGPNGEQDPDGSGIANGPRFCGAGVATLLPVILTGICRWRTGIGGRRWCA